MTYFQSYVYRVILPYDVPLHCVKHPIHCNDGFDHLEDALKPSRVVEILDYFWPQAETDQLSLIIVLHLQAVP
jgi:hypothetical protein